MGLSSAYRFAAVLESYGVGGVGRGLRQALAVELVDDVVGALVDQRLSAFAVPRHVLVGGQVQLPGDDVAAQALVVDDLHLHPDSRALIAAHKSGRYL